MDWDWEATADSNDGGTKWTLTDSGHNTQKPSFIETNDFPEYNDTLTNNPNHPDWEDDQ
ncbi:MAG: hypothetical protein JW787_08165 [Sedimentisphaerales bacterium]|nr:hypothetical protein [Sedimentisphaerales bacterium]